MGVDVGDDFRALEKIEYWQCDTTGLHWYSPEGAAGDEHLYAQLQKFEWYYDSDKWEFDAALSLIPRESRILEVGVGVGHFMGKAKRNGHHVSGVELNTKAAEYVREQGFEVFERDLNELGSHNSEPFDVVCSFQVLEHVSDPRSFIEGMIGVLKPGGKIILSVPNAAVMRRIDPENEDLLNKPPHHVTHWDEDVFRSLEGIFPLKVRSVHREPLARYHVKWFVSSYFRKLLPFGGKRLRRYMVNRYTTFPFQWILYAGLRKWIPGHTILVELEMSR
ncbi:hypothetical protein B0684_12935 [Thioalkalivibrio versutus]|nr:hypothetical protein B0684_12935 [Thioalkalivibrio versutus]